VCVTWSFILKERHWLKVVENRVLRRIIGPKREDGEMRRFIICIRMIKSRRMKWTEHLAHVGFKRHTYKVLVGNSDGKRAFE
jgi:hypothetical protein